MGPAEYDAPRLREGVAIHVRPDGTGFVETPDAVRALRGTALAVLAERVLPLLDGTATVGEIAAAAAPDVAPGEVTRLLEALRRQALLCEPAAAEPAAADPAPRSVLVVAAEGGPRNAVHATLAGLPATRVRATDAPAPDACAGLLDGAGADLVVAVTASLLDPWTGALNSACLERDRPLLVAGLDTGQRAFVGPLWTPGAQAPCYECLRTRLHANSVHGAVRQAYQRHLQGAGTRPVLHPAPPAVLAHLAGWVCHRVGEHRADAHRAHGHGADAPHRLVWIDAVRLATSHHRVLPVPNCAACRGRQRGWFPVRAVGDLAQAHDSRVGIVHALRAWRAERGPRIWLAGTTSADSGRISPALRVVSNGGAGYHEDEARAAALGESLERYAAGLHDPTGLVVSAWRDLTEEAVHPGALGTFSAGQYATPGFAFVPFDESSPLRWVRSIRWHDRTPVLLPAYCVHLPYRRLPGEPLLAPSVSTGLAAGPSLHVAALAALHEVLERDALAISWLHRLPPRVVPPGAVEASARLAAHLPARGTWRVEFHDVSLDLGPPVVVAVMHDRDRGPYAPAGVLSFGVACRSSTTRAAEKAFLEAAQGQSHVRDLLRRHRGWTAAEDFSNVEDFARHAILYTRHPELRAKVRYLVDTTAMPAVRRAPRCEPPSGDRVPSDPAAALDSLCARLREAGHHVHVVELSTPDIRQLGVAVVRVVVPGLQHLEGTHGLAPLGNPRLHDAVRRLGHASRPDNPYPHPLP